MPSRRLALRHPRHLVPVLQQLLQVLRAGMTIGIMLNVVPALAESELGVPRGFFMLLSDGWGSRKRAPVWAREVPLAALRFE